MYFAIYDAGIEAWACACNLSASYVLGLVLASGLGFTASVILSSYIAIIEQRWEVPFTSRA